MGKLNSCLSKFRAAEPVVFLYSFGLLIHSPLIQQYIYDRVSEDKGYNNTVNSRTECANDSDLHDEVCNFIKSYNLFSSVTHCCKHFPIAVIGYHDYNLLSCCDSIYLKTWVRTHEYRLGSTQVKSSISTNKFVPNNSTFYILKFAVT